jgi:hypothetical protein
MKIFSTFFGNKKYVVNNKKRRVTAKYTSIELYEHRNVIVANCIDTSCCPYRRKVYIWDKVTEKALDYGDIDKYINLGDDMFALKIDDEWGVYNPEGYPIRGGITYFSKCRSMDIYIVHIDGKVYFASKEFTLLAGPFVSAADFDAYGYAVVSREYEYYSLLSKGFKEVLGTINCEELKPLSADYFKIRKNGRYGIVDKDKKEIIPAIYDGIQMLGPNHFELMYNRKYGLADINGNVIFECLYDEIMETPDKFVVRDFAKLESGKTIETKK